MSERQDDGTQQDLAAAAAVAQMRAIANGEMAMMCTFDGDQMETRPMATQGIDDDGSFWFFSAKDSSKNHELTADPRVHLIYAKGASSEYLAIEGVATILHDRQKIEQLWTRWAKVWFTAGKDDPALTLIKVTPVRGHYWDTRHNKVVALVKLAVGAVLGTTVNVGVEGELHV